MICPWLNKTNKTAAKSNYWAPRPQQQKPRCCSNIRLPGQGTSLPPQEKKKGKAISHRCAYSSYTMDRNSLMKAEQKQWDGLTNKAGGCTEGQRPAVWQQALQELARHGILALSKCRRATSSWEGGEPPLVSSKARGCSDTGSHTLFTLWHTNLERPTFSHVNLFLCPRLRVWLSELLNPCNSKWNQLERCIISSLGSHQQVFW